MLKQYFYFLTSHTLPLDSGDGERSASSPALVTAVLCSHADSRISSVGARVGVLSPQALACI